MPAQRSVVSSAKLIAVCTLTSRVTGLVRDILLAQAFGLGWVQDAFSYAFQFPHVFRRLFGEGAMAPVFVPTFTRTLEDDGRPAAWRLLARTLALLTATLSVLVILIGLVIAAIWAFVPLAPEQADARGLLLSLTALMLPFILTICVLALLSSILNCVGSFVPAALMPVVLNLVMIAALAVVAPAIFPGVPEHQVSVVALAVVAGGVLQLLLIWPALRAHGVRVGWEWNPGDPVVRHMLKLLGPVALGQGVLVIGIFIDANLCALLTHVADTPPTFTFFGATIAYPLKEGALSAVTYAQRLYQFPLGVLVVSLATAALPTFSRLATRRDWPAWSHEVRQSLRLAIFEGLLAGMLLVMLAEPIVRLLFQHGQFTAAHTDRAGYVAVFYGVGLWAFCAQHIVLRAFYSLGDVRTPVKIVALLLPLNVVSNLILVWIPSIREASFAISTTLTSTLSVALGLWLLSRRTTAPLVDRDTLRAVGKMILAVSSAAAVLHFAAPMWLHWTGGPTGGILARAAETFGLLGIGGVVFIVVAWMLRSNELALLLHRRG